MSKDNTSAARVTEIVELLRPERPRKLPESLTAAAMDGDLERMQLFLDQGADIEQRSFFASPLGAACSRGRVESVRWLIAHGAVLDPPDAQTSPIQSALGKMNCEVAAVLLDAGLGIENAAWGVIAGASVGRLDVILWLLGRGVELDRSYPRLGVLRERALATAEKEGKADIARFLRGEVDPGPSPSSPPMPRMRQDRPNCRSERPTGLACGSPRAGASRRKGGRALETNGSVGATTEDVAHRPCRWKRRRGNCGGAVRGRREAQLRERWIPAAAASGRS